MGLEYEPSSEPLHVPPNPEHQTPKVRDLALIYVLAGVDCIDCSADPAITAAVLRGSEGVCERERECECECECECACECATP